MLVLPDLNVVPLPADVHRQLAAAARAQKVLKKLLKLSIEVQANRELLASEILTPTQPTNTPTSGTDAR